MLDFFLWQSQLYDAINKDKGKDKTMGSWNQLKFYGILCTFLKSQIKSKISSSIMSFLCHKSTIISDLISETKIEFQNRSQTEFSQRLFSKREMR